MSWAYGTAIGMATSSDHGATWRYQGTAQGLDFESGLNTFWAPDVVRSLLYIFYFHWPRDCAGACGISCMRF